VTYEIIIAKVMKYMRIESVIVLSKTSISLLKRFVIRPSGVVSKNDMGARRTRVIARCSIVFPASVPKTATDQEKRNMNKAWLTPNDA
jgi:hypothetical protein